MPLAPMNKHRNIGGYSLIGFYGTSTIVIYFIPDPLYIYIYSPTPVGLSSLAKKYSCCH